MFSLAADESVAEQREAGWFYEDEGRIVDQEGDDDCGRLMRVDDVFLFSGEI